MDFDIPKIAGIPLPKILYRSFKKLGRPIPNKVHNSHLG